jgi:serine/threonine protein kinase/Flp pilus assembly protein TadD
MHPIDEIFWQAAQFAPGDERDAFLDRACGENRELRQRVARLLQVQPRVEGFLERPFVGPAALAALPEVWEGPGSLIGPYKLLKQIGEGGFGVVFLAEQQQPLHRQVALKFLKPGMDSQQVLARFEVERQALALMDHPHIAKVLDAGTTDAGRPYFVMELVPGVPITEFCDQGRLTTRQRLELFVTVCQAVQHAHTKGIIHRDLKPSNVLVTWQDTIAVPKVIDFGIAKATGQRLTERTLFTHFAQLLGTPLYMSPEQAERNSLDVDTRSDVYSLGVLLYELLTGTTPFEKERLQQASYGEMCRILRDEEPPRPSTRINTLGQAATTASARRRSAPRELSRLLHGELDWIVLKALEKDRNRRYESASALAADVERYLHDEAVLACPPAWGYGLRQLARRHKRALITVMAVALALVLGTVASTWEALRAKRAETLAERRLEEAEANLSLARQAVDEMYVQVADELALQPHMQPFQRDVLEKALRFYQEFVHQKRDDPLLQRDRARALLRVSRIRAELGHRSSAKEACDEALTTLEELAAALPVDANRRRLLAEAYGLRGSHAASAGRQRVAEDNFRQAQALFRELSTEHPDDPTLRVQLAATSKQLGGVLTDRPREAELALRTGLQLYEELAAEGRERTRSHVERASLSIELAHFLVEAARPQEAASHLRQALELLDPTVGLAERTGWRSLRASAAWQLGQVLAASRQREAAEKLYRQAVADAEQVILLFPDISAHRDLLAIYSATLATLLKRTGRVDEATTWRARARELFERPALEGANEPQRLMYLEGVAKTLREAGDLETAERLTREVLPLADKLAREEPEELTARLRVALYHGHLGVILQRRGSQREAVEEFRRSLTIAERLAAEAPDDSCYGHAQARALNFLGIALRTLPGEMAAAEQCHRRALAIGERLVAAFPDQLHYRTQLVRSHFALGIVQQLCNRPAEALQSFERALAAHRPYGSAKDVMGDRLQYASIHNERAWLWATWPEAKFRDPARAVASARKAVELEPDEGGFWNTLGAALYRAGDWPEAQAALAQSMALRGGGDAFDWFFLAMIHWQQGERDEAKGWYQQAAAWMDKKLPRNQELGRFRAEAAELLGLKENSP